MRLTAKPSIFGSHTKSTRVGAEPALDPGAPRQQLVEVEGVVEAQQRDAVGDRGEERRRRGADLLAGRVGRDELGELRLELPQLADEGVVVGVGDRGRVELVVEPVVVLDRGPQLVDAGLDLGRDGHRATV